MQWRDGNVYCPPDKWFHQHFSTGAQAARHLALRYSGRVFPLGIQVAGKVMMQGEDSEPYTSIEEGGP